MVVQGSRHPICPIHRVLMEDQGTYHKCSVVLSDGPLGAFAGEQCEYNAYRHDGYWYVCNAEDRKWRRLAHKAFDSLWKRKLMRRNTSYVKLALFMGLSRRDCHISRFNIAQCKQVIDFAKELEERL